MVDAKVEMCNVLSDIAVAQDMLDTKQDEHEEAKPDLPPHPADVQPNTEEYKIINNYCQARSHLLTHSVSLGVPAAVKYTAAYSCNCRSCL